MLRLAQMMAVNAGINLKGNDNANGEPPMFLALLKGKNMRKTNRVPKKVALPSMHEDDLVKDYGDEKKRHTRGIRHKFAALSFFVTGAVTWFLCCEIDARGTGLPAFAVQTFTGTIGGMLIAYFMKDDPSDSPQNGITWGRPTHKLPNPLVMWPILALDIVQSVFLAWGMHLMSSDFLDLIPCIHAILPAFCFFWVVGVYKDKSSDTMVMKLVMVLLALPLEKDTTMAFSKLTLGPIVGIFMILVSCFANALNYAFIAKELVPRHTQRSSLLSMWVCGLVYGIFMLLSIWIPIFPRTTVPFNMRRLYPWMTEKELPSMALYAALILASTLQQLALFFSLNGEHNPTFSTGVNKTAVAIAGLTIWKFFRGVYTDFTSLPLPVFRILGTVLILLLSTFVRKEWKPPVENRKSNFWRGKRAPEERPAKYIQWLHRKHLKAKTQEERAPSPIKGPTEAEAQKRLHKLKMRVPSTGSILKLDRESIMMNKEDMPTKTENIRAKVSPEIVKRLISIKSRVKNLVAMRKAKAEAKLAKQQAAQK